MKPTEVNLQIHAQNAMQNSPYSGRGLAFLPDFPTDNHCYCPGFAGCEAFYGVFVLGVSLGRRPRRNLKTILVCCYGQNYFSQESSGRMRSCMGVPNSCSQSFEYTNSHEMRGYAGNKAVASKPRTMKAKFMHSMFLCNDTVWQNLWDVNIKQVASTARSAIGNKYQNIQRTNS